VVVFAEGVAKVYILTDSPSIVENFFFTPAGLILSPANLPRYRGTSKNVPVKGAAKVGRFTIPPNTNATFFSGSA
jgi:hypothetical protein